MGLTSGPFIGLMIIAAVASVAATVWLWPRFARQRVESLAARLGLIAVSQLLTIAAILVFLNGYFAFFGSWSALFGSGQAPPVPAAGIVASSKPILVTGSDLGPVPGGSDLPELADGRLAAKPPHIAQQSGSATSVAFAPGLNLKDGIAAATRSVGQVLQITVRGEHTGIGSAADYVYLPPQYFQPAYAQARFPVVLVLTGYPNDPWSIVKRLAVPATAARLVSGGQIRPAVYVMMNVSVALPRDTECTNVPEGPQSETFLAQDVPLAVERTFRVQAGRSGWAVLGYSTGGYCAAKLAMMDPYQFSSAVSMAGYYTAIMDNTTGNLYGGSAAFQNENSLDWRLAHLPAPPVSVLVTSSQVGERDLPGTLAFLRLIRPPMRGYSLIVSQGGHNYGTWVRQLPQCLEWLNQRLTPAAPVAPATHPGTSAHPGSSSVRG
jgi:enterochelin esterase-like enzyme